jgi:hypothetical protein
MGDISDLSNYRRRREVRKRIDDAIDRMRLKARFDEFASTLLAEGNHPDDVIDAAFRGLCAAMPDREEFLNWAAVMADMWWPEASEGGE